MKQRSLFDNNIVDFEKIDTYIGIDPGSNGGLAILKNKQIVTYKMQKFLGMVDLLNFYSPENTFVILEQVSTWRNDVDTPGKVMNIAKMMSNYQQILDALAITGLHYMEINGYSWQKKLRVWKKQEDSGERKKRYKEIAEKIFGKKNIRVTLWNADALLIVNYCHMLINNEPQELKKKYYKKYFSK